ncbi:hypothetical protein ABZ614_43505 [Streptomyces sp. NPDC013178]|uniref:hypothetical protein n=1 Tax=unclassified Streptomyces TaxID=2593676 RepID=UPI0033FFB604
MPTVEPERESEPDPSPAPPSTLRRYLVPLLVNLLIGIPTIVLVACARWYAAHGHCQGIDDMERLELGGCTYDQIEDSSFVLIGLITTGLVVLPLLLLFNVLRPLAQDRPLKPRLLTLPAVLLPYVLLLAAAKNG